MRRRTRSFRTTLVVGGAVLALVACGGSPTADPPGGEDEDAGPSAAEEVYAEVAELSGQERRDRLVELAAEEGGLNLYTSMTSDVADATSEAFAEEFGIEVSLYRASSATVLQRVMQEQSAGFAGNDLVETNATELLNLSQEDVLAEYAGERRDLVPDAGQFEGWTATRFNLFAPSWNTDLVAPGEEPTSWEDLADPALDDQMSMELGDYDWYLTLYNYWLDNGKSEEEVQQLFADMADGAKVVSGHTVQAELMSAGEFAVTASNYSYIVERAKAAGAPVETQPYVEPVIARPNGAGLMKTAENPASAMLFVDWLLEEGQQILVDLQLTPAILEGGDDPLEGLEVIPVDIDRLLNESDRWSSEYEELLAGGEVISD